jgi:DNA ligase-1
MSLKTVYEKIRDIAAYGGTLDKQRRIEEHSKDPLFRKVILYALDPFKKFNTTYVDYIVDFDINPQFNFTKEQVDNNKNINGIFQMLDYLSNKRGCTDQERYFLGCISSIDEETNNIVNFIVAKDLRCGANIKLFKKSIPEIPDFGVMLCIDEFRKFNKTLKNLNDAYWSIKLDGVRNYCTLGAEFQHLSRNGKVYPNFGKAFDEYLIPLKEILLKDFKLQFPILDGEVISNKKDFQHLMTQTKRLENANCDIFSFYVFDLAIKNMPWLDRYNILNKAFKTYDSNSKILLLDHQKLDDSIKTEDDLYDFAYKFCDAGHEGLVVKNPNSLYEAKRSNNWLKIKKFKTIDLEVVGWEYGNGKYADVLGYFICNYNGKRVEVGSGLSDDQRVEFMEDTPNIIEVKFFEETNDGSLRFPIFRRRRDDI